MFENRFRVFPSLSTSIIELKFVYWQKLRCSLAMITIIYLRQEELVIQRFLKLISTKINRSGCIRTQSYVALKCEYSDWYTEIISTYRIHYNCLRACHQIFGIHFASNDLTNKKRPLYETGFNYCFKNTYLPLLSVSPASVLLISIKMYKILYAINFTTIFSNKCLLLISYKRKGMQTTRKATVFVLF